MALKVRSSMLVITGHALLRFKERWKPLNEFDLRPVSDDEWRSRLEGVFRHSHEITLPRIKRVLQNINHGEEARFFDYKPRYLRFVTIESELEQVPCIVIKTVLSLGIEYKHCE